jgi:thymidylate synthase
VHRNYVYNNITDALPGLAGAVLRGDEQGSRNGRTRELCHVGVTLSQPWQREIVLHERKANIAAQIAETMWVLSGRDDMAFLSQYLPRATDYSDDGKVWRGAYGPRLRAWKEDPWNKSDGLGETIDQWERVLSELKRDPLSRRTTMSIYDPAIDTEPGKDIPCNNWLVFTNRLGYLDLQVGIRSNDLLWGWSGINAFEWSALLEISAGLLGVKTGCLHFSIASLHLYEQHWPKAERLTLQERPDGLDDSPRFHGAGRSLMQFDALADEWFRVEAMIREQGATAADDAVLDFPEPMLRSWLRVLQWWWSGDHQYLKDIGGTRLEYATHVAMQPPARTSMLDVLRKGLGEQEFKRAAASVGVSAGESAAQAGATTHTTVSPTPYGDALVTTEVTVKGTTRSGLADEPGDVPDFIDTLCDLHVQKHAAYGHSWKKRGEMLGILANIARKVDRLGGSETDDETSADTAGDLLVYLAKYQSWMFDHRNGTDHSDGTTWPNKYLRELDEQMPWTPVSTERRALLEKRLREQFDRLEAMTVSQDPSRGRLINSMAVDAYTLARHLWEQAQEPPARTWQQAEDDYRGADVD